MQLKLWRNTCDFPPGPTDEPVSSEPQHEVCESGPRHPRHPWRHGLSVSVPGAATPPRVLLPLGQQLRYLAEPRFQSTNRQRWAVYINVVEISLLFADQVVLGWVCLECSQISQHQPVITSTSKAVLKSWQKWALIVTGSLLISKQLINFSLWFLSR